MRALLRPLPLSIAAMLLLAVVKLAGLVHAIGPSLASAGASAGRTVLPSAIAAESKPHEEARPKPTPAPAPAVPPPAAAVPAPAAAAIPVAAAPPVPAAPGPSEAERTLLQDLRTRRELLDTRERTLEARDGLLKAAERGLSERLDQLAAMQVRLESLEKARREHAEANWNGLVKTYEAMRPRDAAAIFNELEQAVLMPVLDRMKEAKAAAVLAAMQPDRARTATTQLAQWRTRGAGGPPG